MTRIRNFTKDDELELKDAGLVATSAAAQVDSAAKILDLGGADIFCAGDIVLEVSAIEIASNTEIYDIIAQISPDATFGTAGNIIDRIALNLSAKEVKRSDCDRDDLVGRYVLPFDNEWDGTCYRYLRLYTVVAGDIVTGINFTGWFCKKTP